MTGRRAATKWLGAFLQDQDNERPLIAVLATQRYSQRHVRNVTRILSAIEQGDRQAARQLLPLVYDELRRLAAEKLAREKPGQTLDATALVHEAYLRLVASEGNEPAEQIHH